MTATSVTKLHSPGTLHQKMLSQAVSGKIFKQAPSEEQKLFQILWFCKVGVFFWYVLAKAAKIWMAVGGLGTSWLIY